MGEFPDIVGEYLQKTDCQGKLSTCYKPAVYRLDFMCMECSFLSSHTFCGDCVKLYTNPTHTIFISKPDHDAPCKTKPAQLVWQDTILPYTA